jgi:hypothetical protein
MERIAVAAVAKKWAVLPSAHPAPAQSQPDLVHERGGWQRLPGPALRHSLRRHPAQFLIHDWNQLLSGLGVAVRHRPQELRDVVHGRKIGGFLALATLKIGGGPRIGSDFPPKKFLEVILWVRRLRK